MGWTAWDIPGWREDAKLRDFYRNALHPEMIADIELYRARCVESGGHADRLRKSLEYLLAERPATVSDWWGITRFSFLTEDNLYGYLQELYAYLYGDRTDPPPAPEY